MPPPRRGRGHRRGSAQAAGGADAEGWFDVPRVDNLVDGAPPVQMRRASDSPRAFFIRNFVSDGEIAEIKRSVAGALHESLAGGAFEDTERSDYRTSTQAWAPNQTASSLVHQPVDFPQSNYEDALILRERDSQRLVLIL